VLVLGHRGARRVAPENTLAAFRAARTQGADGIELDVHATADNALVVHHDADAPGLGALAACSLDEIRIALPTVPTLAEALDSCLGLMVNVEIKDSSADLVATLLRGRGGRDRVIVSSFDLASIDRVRALEPALDTGLLSFGLDPLDTLARANERGHTAVHPDAWSLVGNDATAFVRRARDAGLEVNTWTVNDPDVVRGLADAGVDGVITDVPDLALRALGRAPEPPT
jgi:glycerophosphoryl diester phosphodiesterase